MFYIKKKYSCDIYFLLITTIITYTITYKPSNWVIFCLLIICKKLHI
jgi:hypothetical protein